MWRCLHTPGVAHQGTYCFYHIEECRYWPFCAFPAPVVPFLAPALLPPLSNFSTNSDLPDSPPHCNARPILSTVRLQISQPRLRTTKVICQAAGSWRWLVGNGFRASYHPRIASARSVAKLSCFSRIFLHVCTLDNGNLLAQNAQELLIKSSLLALAGVLLCVGVRGMLNLDAEQLSWGPV